MKFCVISLETHKIAKREAAYDADNENKTKKIMLANLFDYIGTTRNCSQ